MRSESESKWNRTMIPEIKIRYSNPSPVESRPLIKSAQSGYEHFLESWDKYSIELFEQVKVLYLDQSNRCLGITEHASGGISFCAIDGRILFATALLAKASGMILCHNHPSGNLMPSQLDVIITQRLVLLGKLHEIRILDHLIISKYGYYSFAEHGQLEEISINHQIF